MKKQGGTIKNWRIGDGRVFGDIYYDPRFRPGEAIHTSDIVSIKVETRNTVYYLSPEDQQDSTLKRYAGRED